MVFLSPIWLVGLAPWFGLMVWLLLGRREQRDVPFIHLWQGPVQGEREKRSIYIPPIPVIFLLAAMLAAIFAAAHPVIPDPTHGPKISIVIDRGVTLSAKGEKDFRFRELAAAMKGPIGRKFGSGDVELVVVPGDSFQTTRTNWASDVNRMSPTALDSHTILGDTVRRLARESTNQILVLSDQAVEVESSRVLQVAPTTQPQNVGIVNIACRLQPKPQLMLRVRNQSDSNAATVQISENERRVSQQIRLPKRDGEQDYFFDLPWHPTNISAEVVASSDDLPADNVAWLVRQSAWPKVEARSNLSPAMSRMIDSYSKSRPGDQLSKTVGIAVSDSVIDGANVILSPGGNSTQIDPSKLTIADHPITRDVDWSQIDREISVATSPPAGFLPVVSFNGKVLIAVQESPVRKVWVGFESANWAKQVSYVVFWTSVFNWTGEGGEEFIASPVQQLGKKWNSLTVSPSPIEEAGLWPGLYKNADGATRAINATDVRLPPALASDGRAKLEAISFETGGQRNISEAFTIGAMICLLAAVLRWPRGGLTAFSGARTVESDS